MDKLAEICTKLRNQGLRVDITTGNSQQIELDEFDGEGVMVPLKIETLILDEEGKLAPKLSLTVSGFHKENPSLAAEDAYGLALRIIDDETVIGVSNKYADTGLSIVTSQPIHNMDGSLMVCVKVEIIDYNQQGKPRTMHKIALYHEDKSVVTMVEAGIQKGMELLKICLN